MPDGQQEHFARIIIQIMKDGGTKPGQIMMLGAIESAWLKARGERKDFEDGLAYALEQGWLENASRGAVRLTVEGAKMSAHIRALGCNLR